MMASEDDRTGAELAELRAELARFVLREAGAAAAETPDLGLGPALKGVVDAAVRESLDKALRSRRDLDPAAFAERVLRLAEAQAGTATVAPAAVSYTEIVPASGWAQSVARRPLAMAASLVVLLIVVFAAGWFARGQLAPAATPGSTPESTPVSAPASTGAAEADPDAVSGGQAAAASAAPSSQPAVLNGVELSGRSTAVRARPAAGGRTR